MVEEGDAEVRSFPGLEGDVVGDAGVGSGCLGEFPDGSVWARVLIDEDLTCLEVRVDMGSIPA